MRRLILAVALAGCASPGMPPGGPPDAQAPRLIAIAPDSGRTRVAPREVIFRFDETVSERPTGVTDLASLFIISPQDGTPNVDWSRSEVSVRPRRGWRRNTVYTVRLLPGITDLRGNVSRVGAQTVFSTGDAIPATSIRGRVFDWVAGIPATGGFVQAMAPDSTTYVTVADTAGAFALAHLPPGTYVLRGIIDENRNRALDPRERFDSITVALTDTMTIDLLAFAQDSVAPRLLEVTERDSMALSLVFDLALDPAQQFTTDQFRITAPDSSRAPIWTVEPIAPDTTLPRLRRPIPPRGVTVVLRGPLRRDATYIVRAERIRGLTGVAASSERTFRAPAMRSDTTATRP